MSTSKTTPSLARPLSPEDIEPGQYLIVLQIIEQYALLACPDDPALRRITLVEIERRPCEEHFPMLVRGVCLPCVLVRGPTREETLDVRNYRFAQLDERFARLAMKHLKPKPLDLFTGSDKGRKRKRKRKRD